ncbi:MAG: Bax inhibitor-1/YccA family protein [Candidatus Eisenbacteria bacterium]|uniref:Bax inhibitor-1/YccA family protein n=1 Tax=Eiseniibacteriota bacterium TaxID=2212470 RepID=A0A7Y2H3B5_UNCEI|nr:Bax inhibitor-1/YccA family protein [Candidatus Eisenbacteria bacterium]
MRTANPALSTKVWEKAGRAVSNEVMTIQGTVNKTAILLLLVVLPAAFVWNKFAAVAVPPAFEGAPSTAPYAQLSMWMIGGMIAGVVFALATIFKKTWAPVTAPLYAVAEGCFLGGMSLLFNTAFPGIVPQAIALTFGVLFVLLGVYKAGWIKVTQKFRMMVVGATGAIALLYIVSFVMGFFGSSIPFIHSSGTFGILFSLFVVAIAALNLVLDFDLIERGSEAGAPKYMEWYSAFGLMITLIWLYLEILRLLAKLQNRD